MNPREIDLAKFNTLTKYPSIETYHAIGDKGRLKEELRTPIPEGAELIATEKVDGTSVRICVFGRFHEALFDARERRTYLIGSREELLTARGDLIPNRALGIVDGVRAWAESIVTGELDTMVRTHGCLDYVTIFYGEMYGGSLPEAKRYTGTKAVGFRLFDAAIYKPEELKELLSKSVEDIAAMREHLVYQKFLHEGALQRLAAAYGLDVTPRLTVIGPPPESHFGTLTWLMSAFPNHDGVLPPTNVALDGTPGGAEGIVLRTPDRKFICKIRFEDYERTLRADYQRASGR